MSRSKINNSLYLRGGAVDAGVIQNSSIIKQDDNHIYYNITITNPNNFSRRATYFETRSSAIIENPSEWHLAVIRFIISGASIPILVPRIQPFPNVDVNKTIYSITMSYGGSNVQQFITYVPANNYPPPTPFTSTSPRQPITFYYYIYSYQDFIDMINTTFESVFTALKVLQPAAPPTKAPYMVFDSVTGLISIIAPLEYDPDYVGAPTIEVFFNGQLFTLFESFMRIFLGFNEALGKDFQLVFKNNGNNLTTYTTPLSLPYLQWDPTVAYAIGDVVSYLGYYYISLAGPNMGNVPSTSIANWKLNNDLNAYEMKQEFKTLFFWNTMKKIVFISNTIPIKQEYLPGSTNVGFNTTVSDNSKFILTDFEPLQDNPIRSYLQFFVTGPYRLMDLISTTPLKTFDVQIYWQDDDQNLYPLDIVPGNSFSIKFLFQKKLALLLK
jgi:hypothetical protein